MSFNWKDLKIFGPKKVTPEEADTVNGLVETLVDSLGDLEEPIEDEDFEVTLPDNATPSGKVIPNSPQWLFDLNYIDSEIAGLRTSNDKLSLDAIQTSAIRGQIKALKKMREKLSPRPIISRPKKSSAEVLTGEEY